MSVLETDFCKMWKEDGIIYLTMTSINIDEGMVNSMIDMKIQLAEGKDFSIISDMTKVYHLSDKAKAAFGSKQSIQNTNFTAIIINSPFQVMIYNLFSSFYKIPVPTKLFYKKDDALLWIKTMNCTC